MIDLQELERAYREAAHQAIGAKMMRLELLLDLSPAARLKASAYELELEGKAQAALSRWKTATGCTPDFEARYIAQQRGLVALNKDEVSHSLAA